MPDKTNVFTGLPTVLPEEVFTILLDRPGLRIERIVSQGQASPPGFWFDQAQCEWVMVLQGAARLRFEGEDQVVDMAPGEDERSIARPLRRCSVEWRSGKTLLQTPDTIIKIMPWDRIGVRLRIGAGRSRIVWARISAQRGAVGFQ